jgi:hypothetical protein
MPGLNWPHAPHLLSAGTMPRSAIDGACEPRFGSVVLHRCALLQKERKTLPCGVSFCVRAFCVRFACVRAGGAASGPQRRCCVRAGPLLRFLCAVCATAEDGPLEHLPRHDLLQHTHAASQHSMLQHSTACCNTAQHGGRSAWCRVNRTQCNATCA